MASDGDANICSIYPQTAIDEVLALRSQGLGARRIARRTNLPVSTVRDWVAGRVPRAGRGPGCPACGHRAHEFGALPNVYVYLLGLYLGDGCLASHARGVFKLRIILDTAHPGIIREAQAAIAEVIGSGAGCADKPGNCVEVYSYSRSWPCLFPQHAAGKKHERLIRLEPWQEQLVARAPEQLLRGLIHSDGCRFRNTGRDGWEAPRYGFYNLSEDIRGIFCAACDLLELRWTSAPNTIYVSRKADVARMDEFIGPKS